MFKQYIFLLILLLFSAQSFAGSCPDGSEPVKSISADGTYFVFECSSTMETEGNLIKYNFNKGVGTPFCDDSRGYCASWKVNASKKCKDNYRFGENYSSTQERLNYEACIEQIEFKPFIGTKLNRSSNASPTMNEKANADRLIKAGWDKPTLVQPIIIAASDVPKVIKDAIKEGLDLAVDRMGNYGPLKIYIIGNDDSVIEPIIKDFCNWSKNKSYGFQRCSDDQGKDMREMAYIFPGGNGFASHGWYLQKPTQTFVLNPYAGYSNEFLALTNNQELKQDKVVTAHEYFHVYQGAHTVFRGEENSVYSLPRWIEESHAVYFSWVLGNENGWIDINSRIRGLINSISSFRKRVPGMTILDIESESGTKRVKDYCGELCIGKLQFEYALLATIILAQKTSDDAVFIDFYKNHKDIGWIAAFEKTFNMSVDDFYLELEEFLNKKIDFQIEQLTVSVEESYEDILLKSARIDAKQKISGFRFIQEKYHKMVKKDGVLVKSAPETEITGWYQRLPEENDWHTGIIFFEKGQLKWKNEAGVEWNLQPDINNNKLITGEDNPYQTKYEPDFRLIKTSEKSKSASKEVSTIETNESVDYVERLKQVKALLDSGIINQDDFEKMKQKIIDTMN